LMRQASSRVLLHAWGIKYPCGGCLVGHSTCMTACQAMGHASGTCRNPSSQNHEDCCACEKWTSLQTVATAPPTLAVASPEMNLYYISACDQCSKQSGGVNWCAETPGRYQEWGDSKWTMQKIKLYEVPNACSRIDKTTQYTHQPRAGGGKIYIILPHSPEQLAAQTAQSLRFLKSSIPHTSRTSAPCNFSTLAVLGHWTPCAYQGLAWQNIVHETTKQCFAMHNASCTKLDRIRRHVNVTSWAHSFPNSFPAPPHTSWAPLWHDFTQCHLQRKAMCYEPHTCTTEPASPATLLHMLRGRAVVFAGDSLTRGLFQSMVCFLWSANMGGAVEIITTQDYKSYVRSTLHSPLSLGGQPDLFICVLLRGNGTAGVEVALCYVVASRADNFGAANAAVVYNRLRGFADLFVLDPFGHFQPDMTHGQNVLDALISSSAFKETAIGPQTLIWDRHATHFDTKDGLWNPELRDFDKCGASTVGSHLDRASIPLSRLPAANRLLVYEASRDRPDDHVSGDCNHACTCLHGGVHEWVFTQIEHKLKFGELKLSRQRIALADRLEALEHCRQPCVDDADGQCPRHTRDGGCNATLRVRCPRACGACDDDTAQPPPIRKGGGFTLDCAAIDMHMPGRVKQSRTRQRTRAHHHSRKGDKKQAILGQNRQKEGATGEGRKAGPQKESRRA
jgi:hypothetical protein